MSIRDHRTGRDLIRIRPQYPKHHGKPQRKRLSGINYSKLAREYFSHGKA